MFVSDFLRDREILGVDLISGWHQTKDKKENWIQHVIEMLNNTEKDMVHSVPLLSGWGQDVSV